MTNIEKAKSSKTFCIYPWIAQYVGPKGDVKPCCAFDPERELGSLKENTLEYIWNNETTKQMRLDMLEGKKIRGCEKCDNREGIIEPHRTNINKEMFYADYEIAEVVESTLPDGSLSEHKLRFIDARFNNLCNLKCRTCGIDFSTSWYDDYLNTIKPGTIPIAGPLRYPGQTEDQLINEILPQVKNLKRIYFAGGEPLMQKEHYMVLEELIKVGHLGHPPNDLYIYYNTNFTNLKLGKYHALDMWNKFKKVEINASIDGSYKRAEYWRKGTNWSKVVQNRKDMMEKCPNIKFRISYTLSWVNAFNLLDLHKEWVENGMLKIDNVNLNFLEGPLYYSLKNIPNWKKKKIEEAFKEHIHWLVDNKAPMFAINQYTDAIKFMYSKDTGDEFLYKDDFLQVNSLFDELRKEDFWEIFPEHNDIKEYLNDKVRP